MIRICKLILKENLFNYVYDSNISRVELANSYNKRLLNKDICKVYLYLRANKNEFHSIAGAIQCVIKDIKLDSEDKCFLTGISNIKQCGFISHSKLVKLVQLKEKYNTSFNIPKYFFKLIFKYK